MALVQENANTGSENVWLKLRVLLVVIMVHENMEMFLHPKNICQHHSQEIIIWEENLSSDLGMHHGLLQRSTHLVNKEKNESVINNKLI
jgi:hypothetical protein